MHEDEVKPDGKWRESITGGRPNHACDCMCRPCLDNRKIVILQAVKNLTYKIDKMHDERMARDYPASPAVNLDVPSEPPASKPRRTDLF